MLRSEPNGKELMPPFRPSKERRPRILFSKREDGMWIYEVFSINGHLLYQSKGDNSLTGIKMKYQTLRKIMLYGEQIIFKTKQKK